MGGIRPVTRRLMIVWLNGTRFCCLPAKQTRTVSTFRAGKIPLENTLQTLHLIMKWNRPRKTRTTSLGGGHLSRHSPSQVRRPGSFASFTFNAAPIRVIRKLHTQCTWWCVPPAPAIPSRRKNIECDNVYLTIKDVALLFVSRPPTFYIETHLMTNWHAIIWEIISTYGTYQHGVWGLLPSHRIHCWPVGVWRRRFPFNAGRLPANGFSFYTHICPLLSSSPPPRISDGCGRLCKPSTRHSCQTFASKMKHTKNVGCKLTDKFKQTGETEMTAGW